MKTPFTLRPAQPADVPAIVGLIRELAEFEQLGHLVVTTPESLQPHLFGAKPVAEAVVAEVEGTVVAFALFFTNFSTFLGRPGLYLEDLYVQPAHRGTGLGKMERAGLERERHPLLREDGGHRHAGLAHLPGDGRGPGRVRA